MENKQIDSFVIYRMPHEKTTHLIQGCCEALMKPLDELKGNNFVISPFNQGQNVYFIPFLNEEVFDKNHFGYLSHNELQEPSINSEKRFLENISLAKKEMSLGTLKKVVLANKKDISVDYFDPLNFFLEIEKEYNNAFVYFLTSPQTGTWIGASPEPLITTNGDEHKTIALAGTIIKDTDQVFGTKEFHEQNLVEVFIEDTLNQTGIQFTKNGPKQQVSAKLIHLKTEYTFRTQKNNEQIFKLIAALNPTPATAGIPRQIAIDFINKHEGFDRLLYTGFLGIVKENKANLFVNLRCMQYSKKQITLYAGAGITSESNATDEWLETQNKMKTLENFIK